MKFISTNKLVYYYTTFIQYHTQFFLSKCLSVYIQPLKNIIRGGKFYLWKKKIFFFFEENGSASLHLINTPYTNLFFYFCSTKGYDQLKLK